MCMCTRACVHVRACVYLHMKLSQFVYTDGWTATGPQINLAWNLKHTPPCLSIDDSWYGNEDEIMVHMLLMFHMVCNPPTGAWR